MVRPWYFGIWQVLHSRAFTKKVNFAICKFSWTYRIFKALLPVVHTITTIKTHSIAYRVVHKQFYRLVSTSGTEYRVSGKKTGLAQLRWFITLHWQTTGGEATAQRPEANFIPNLSPSDAASVAPSSHAAALSCSDICVFVQPYTSVCWTDAPARLAKCRREK